MKNNGIYNFQINSVFFDVEIDSTRDVYSLPVKIIIDGDDYRKHNIKEIKIINVKNSEEFSGRSFLTNQIEFGLNEAFNDSLRSKTIQNINNLDLFSFPSIAYEYINESDDELSANIFLNPKKIITRGANIIIKASGDAKRASPIPVKFLIEPSLLVSIANLPNKSATPPVRTSAVVI